MGSTRMLPFLALVACAAAVIFDDANESFWERRLAGHPAASQQAIVDVALRPDTGTEGPATPQSSARSLDLSGPNIGGPAPGATPLKAISRSAASG